MESNVLRVHIPTGTTGVKVHSDILIDQLKTIDNKRLVSKVGELPKDLVKKVKDNIRIVLEL